MEEKTERAPDAAYKEMSLGDRMKAYERIRSHKIPKDCYLVIRLDGKAFHTYTKGFEKPFDRRLVDAMAETTKFLCDNLQGCKFGYTQSDEISLILTDFDKVDTQALFDGKIQKIISTSASLATAKFNQQMMMKACSDSDGDLLENMIADYEIGEFKLGMFDSRLFTFYPEQIEEAINSIIWRQQDAIKNSISAVAQANFSHRKLHKKNAGDMLEMLETYDPWEKYPLDVQRGIAVRRTETEFEVPAGPHKGQMVKRNKFTIDREMPIISENKEYLRDIIKIERNEK